MIRFAKGFAHLYLKPEINRGLHLIKPQIYTNLKEKP